ncbi:MAG: DUF4810 domain-containing protein [Planctomycetota bacterium]
MRRRLILALAAAVTAAACSSTPQRYEWGSYQESVYLLTAGEGQVDVDAQIQAMNATVEQARQRDRPVPPGMHAHIGLLYSMRGELDLATAAFETERELYPESAGFINGMLTRMRAQP